jgi:hypothetical protein
VHAYVPFMINRGLSYFPDTVLFANEMNMHPGLPPKMQYDFLKNGIRAKKRFSKWQKQTDNTADVELIMLHLSCNSHYAREVLGVYTPKALHDLREKYNKGGMTK